MASSNSDADVPPDGARCGAHPERLAVFVCRRCGDFVCRACKGSAAKCNRCLDPEASRRAATPADPALALTGYGKASVALSLVSLLVNPLLLLSMCAAVAGLVGTVLLLFSKQRSTVTFRPAHIALAILGLALAIASALGRVMTMDIPNIIRTF